eukprot:467737_1
MERTYVLNNCRYPLTNGLLALGGTTAGLGGLLGGLVLVEANVARDAGLELLEHGHGGAVNGDAVLDLLVNKGDVGDEVHAALALLLLELEGDAADGAAGKALHDVGGVAGDLVLELLGGGDGAVEDNALVDVEVLAKLVEVLLNDLLGGALDGLGADLSHG